MDSAGPVLLIISMFFLENLPKRGPKIDFPKTTKIEKNTLNHKGIFLKNCTTNKIYTYEKIYKSNIMSHLGPSQGPLAPDRGPLTALHGAISGRRRVPYRLSTLSTYDILWKSQYARYTAKAYSRYVSYYKVLQSTLMYCTVLYYFVLSFTVLYCTVLYCTVPYCNVPYCTVPFCYVLYCSVLYFVK